VLNMCDLSVKRTWEVSVMPNTDTHHGNCVGLARLSIIVELTLLQHLNQCRPFFHLRLQVGDIRSHLSTGLRQVVSVLDALTPICTTQTLHFTSAFQVSTYTTAEASITYHGQVHYPKG